MPQRPYLRVTQEIETQILAHREHMGTASFADIAEATGYPERTVRYVLTDLPRLRRAQEGDSKADKSLKERLYVTIRDLGTARDVAELRRVMGLADDEHNIVHVLHSLHGQGRIDFDERRNGGGPNATAIVNIRVAKKHRKSGSDIVNAGIPFDQKPLPVISRQQEERAISEAHSSGPEATTPQLSAPEPDAEAYPLLDELLDRERKRLDGDTKGMAFVVAAEAIQHLDPETAAVLMDKAKQYDVPFPSPLEAEYIRYVASHGVKS